MALVSSGPKRQIKAIASMYTEALFIRSFFYLRRAGLNNTILRDIWGIEMNSSQVANIPNRLRKMIWQHINMVLKPISPKI
ncbi:hypothetical protein EA769_14785 [Acinetobacter haemolyticus]|nr:hypothetical protein BSR56_00925 [Acinetobacter haemolyticus]RSN73719.1 hypothetical protein EA769_14785 [Acinetobacter haemolyticus]